jgi:hypothetical protein
MVLRATVVALVAGLAAVVPITAEAPVWFWHTTCGGPTMTLEVRFDKRVVYRASIPLCRMNREAKTEEKSPRVLDVPFAAPRSIKWEGYRDAPDVTPRGQRLHLNLWQAGADPDDLVIGVSAANESVILMNTVHIAHPVRRDATEVAQGLVVVTYPGSEKVTKP